VAIRIVFALIDQLLEEGEHLLRCFRVQVAGWLIGKNDRRIVGEGASNGDTLLLPAGYGGWQFMRLVSHADLIKGASSLVRVARAA
jgi:hypothetical protein